jgi:hypothetical protein
MMAELTPLVDFPAIVTRVQSMTDKGIRVQFDLPETETKSLMELHRLQRDDKVLRVVIYDDDEFRETLIAENKQKNA